MAHYRFDAGDLAPGDARSAAFDAGQIEVIRVPSAADPLFAQAYGRLWAQFGAAAEIETPEVLGRRLAWDPAVPRAGFSMLYDLLVVRSSGAFVAVRDHTAIGDAAGAVVHLSHLLVEPEWRRSGLAGWLRALPLQTARACLSRGGFSPEAPVTLAGEMEYPDGADEARIIRLKAYERAGFRKVDPAVIDYHQPDFRAPEAIDASGGAVPLRFQLVVRGVGRENETHLAGAEVRSIVERFYHMYAQECRPRDMAAVWKQLESYPGPDARIALVPPTAGT
ncbi:MAG: hypothetical protein QOE70_5142 [Chthoniobacter sp.]|jgi:GNAT superfamily N-acetyltransferase|nr:hypothetical protein [Chthoniobacter sp.]